MQFVSPPAVQKEFQHQFQSKITVGKDWKRQIVNTQKNVNGGNLFQC